MKEKRLPYEDTTVAAEVTQAQIQKLLYEFGAEAVQWSSMKDGQPQLKFVFRAQGRPMSFTLTPPIFLHRRTKEPAMAQSLRLLFWYLKSKLEAISYGLATVEEEFMAEISGSLPSGQTITLGELLLTKVAEGGVLGADAFLKQLGSGKEEKIR